MFQTTNQNIYIILYLYLYIIYIHSIHVSSPNLSLSGFFGPRPGLTAVRAVGHVHHPFPTGAVHEGAHHLSAWPCSNAWCSDGCVWLCICQIWRDLTWFNQLDQLGTTSLGKLKAFEEKSTGQLRSYGVLSPQHQIPSKIQFWEKMGKWAVETSVVLLKTSWCCDMSIGSVYSLSLSLALSGMASLTFSLAYMPHVRSYENSTCT